MFFYQAVYLIEEKHSEYLTRLVTDGYASAALRGVGSQTVVAVFCKVFGAGMVAFYNMYQERFDSFVADLGAKHRYQFVMRNAGEIFQNVAF